MEASAILMVFARAAAAGWASARGSSDATSATRIGATIDRTGACTKPPGGREVFVTVSAPRNLRLHTRMNDFPLPVAEESAAAQGPSKPVHFMGCVERLRFDARTITHRYRGPCPISGAPASATRHASNDDARNRAEGGIPTMTSTTTRASRTPDIDAPLFVDLGVSKPVAGALAMRGIPSAFPIQALVLRDAMAGRDIQARSRTGSGKTLAFAIPIVERLEHSGRSPQALILAPTRELASQVTEEFRAIADVKQLEIAAVYGGVGIGPQAKRARHADVLIATPGRLLDLVERKLVRLDRVRIAVLDEADRMLDMGFLPDVRRILAML